MMYFYLYPVQVQCVANPISIDHHRPSVISSAAKRLITLASDVLLNAHQATTKLYNDIIIQNHYELNLIIAMPLRR